MPPCRIVDTRNPDGPLGGPAIAAAGAPDRLFTLAGTCGIPPGAAAVVANLTVVGPTAPGFLLLYRGDGSVPGTSMINFAPGTTRTSDAVLRLSLDGSGTVKVNNASAGPLNLVVDVSGYFQ